MLIGPSWVLDHLRLKKGPGNTLCGREWTARIRQENSTFRFQCDSCGVEELLDPSCGYMRARHVVRRCQLQEGKYGHHLCPRCVRPHAGVAAKATKSTVEWKAKQAGRSSWQSLAEPSRLADWKKSIGDANTEVNANKSPEERSIGVQKQWAAMTTFQRDRRGAKITQALRTRWASLSPDERNTLIQKMIRGRPRSQVSEEFKAGLIQAGLYCGFESEQAVSGFVADEVNHEQKIVLEFYGDYYHCNPRHYGPDDYNTTIGMTAKDKWQYDRRRFAAMRKAGFQVLIVWEHDWRTNPKHEINRVQDFLHYTKKGTP